MDERKYLLKQSSNVKQLCFVGLNLHFVFFVVSFSSSVRRQNMKVRINATGDTIVMKFVRPSPDVKLEGYILGYGSSMFSKQFIQLPENGQPYETEMGKMGYGGQKKKNVYILII